MTGSGGALVVFDVCDTLFRENTTAGFVRFFHEVRGNRSYRRRERLLVSHVSPFFYAAAIAERALGLGYVRAWQIRSLRGAERSTLQAVAARYVREVLHGLRNEPIHEALDGHQARGHRVVLVSASLDVVVAAIAETLGTEYRASTLAFQGEICLGRLADDLSGAKVRVATALRGEAGDQRALHVYTDNHSDAGLLAMADRPTIVIPAGRTRSRWGNIDAAYIELRD